MITTHLRVHDDSPVWLWYDHADTLTDGRTNRIYFNGVEEPSLHLLKFYTGGLKHTIGESYIQPEKKIDFMGQS